MIKEILANTLFELKIRYRSLSSYAYFAMFFLLSLLMTLGAGGAFAGVTISFGTSSKVFVNSPMSIAFYSALLTAFQLFIIAAVFGQSICKDYINKMDQIVFTTPIKTTNFLLGRFVGAVLFLTLISASVPLGVFVASSLPFILPSMIGEQQLLAYLAPILTVALPNIFIFGSLFFLMGTKTKKMPAIYVSAVLLFLMWSASGSLLKDVDNKTIATLLDPIGLSAMGENIRYWTVDQQTKQFLGFNGYYLWNRLLWLSVGLLSLLSALITFSKLPLKEKTGRSKKNEKAASKTLVAKVLEPIKVDSAGWMTQFRKILSFEIKQSMKSIYFIVIALAGVGYMFIAGTQIGSIFGTNTYPVTYNVLEVAGGTFNLFILIIITLFTGEAVWRDRDIKIDQIVDSTQTNNFAFFAAKYLSVVALTLALLSSVIVSGVIIQLSLGYTHLELSQYFTRIYLIQFPALLNLVSLTFFLQVISRNKYLGHAMVVGFYVLSTFAGAMGFEHRLYKFNSTPSVTYSDMNGFGHLFKIFHIYNSYWFSLSILLLIVSFLFWQRGSEKVSFRKSWPQVRSQLSPALLSIVALAMAGFVGIGSYLFYQNNVINEYVTSKEAEQRSFEYEKHYKQYENLPQPELKTVKAYVDIFPYQLKTSIRADLSFKNMSSEPISKIMLNHTDQDWSLEFSKEVVLSEEDKDLDVVFYDLTSPLQPGEEMTAVYTANIDKSSIENGSNISQIHHNGTFFTNFQYLPVFGYLNNRELSESKTREKYGLPAKPRVAAIDDKTQYQFNLLGEFASWIDFEAIVSTAGDQIAIAPGYLQKEWTENGRRYFHYKMDQKILNFYSFLSGRYEVKRDKWNDVAIEVYYHKAHDYNVDAMIESAKKSLEYYSKNFGPYQHKQYRIIEFPRYSTYAQSFPNTIPFSEGIGFIAKVDKDSDTDVDYPFYVNAHELAHQWWPHQVIGARVQGTQFLSESFSQYSALMVMEKEYGREDMKRFLKYELDRYLFGRGQEKEYETPLYLAEGQQYIHYNKGSLALYALKDYIGEDVINASLREVLSRYTRTEGPYMTSLDFIAILKDKTPKDQHPIIEDLLQKIVLFENRPLEAKAVAKSDGQYDVTLKISSKKIEADKMGKETYVDFQQPIDIGVLDDKGEYIYLKKHIIKNGESSITVQTNKKPAQAGIDPLNILIDRVPKDNVMSVSVDSTATPEATTKVINK